MNELTTDALPDLPEFLLARIVLEFLRAKNTGQKVDPRVFAERCSLSNLLVLRELVLLEFESLWTSGQGISVEVQRRRYPELIGDMLLLKKLIVIEFENTPGNPDEMGFILRFPNFEADIRQLKRIRHNISLSQSLGTDVASPNAEQAEIATDDLRLFARLLRRMRFSDSPERFRQLAVNVLASVLRVAAVAWVPNNLHQSVTICGEVEGFWGTAYRSLISASTQGTVLLANQITDAPGSALKRFVAVSDESRGPTNWLIAVNPLDDRPFGSRDIEMLRFMSAMIISHQINSCSYDDFKFLVTNVIRSMTSAIDAKDPYSSGHSERVARIAVRIGKELGLSDSERGDLYLMGLLHDVGKIGVDDAVLKKAGPLTPEEYRVIQSHVEIGVHILADLKKLNHLLPGVRHHHESLDGTGYPCGLAGDAIPLEARILAVADSFDAMSSARPYRRRLTPSQIDEILRKGSGVQWDPKIIDALFACRMDVEHIRQKGLGESLQVVVNETLGRI